MPGHTEWGSETERGTGSLSLSEGQHHIQVFLPCANLSHWPVSTDPAVHVQAIQNVVNAGVTRLFVHSTQQDQVAVVDFFGRQVLPRIHAGAIKGVRQVMGM